MLWLIYIIGICTGISIVLLVELIYNLLKDFSDDLDI